MHLTDEQLNEYLDRESSERGEIEEHISTCADCAARLSALQSLFDEIESLPELEFTHPVAARFTLRSSLPAKLPRFLTLTATLQAVLAIVIIISGAPFVMQFISPYWVNISVPSLADVIVQIQAQWTFWLDTLAQIQMPSVPEIPVVELSSLFIMLAVAGVSLLWLIGNGLLLRNKER